MWEPQIHRKRQENTTLLQRSFVNVAMRFVARCSATRGDICTAEKGMLQCNFCSANVRKLQRNFCFCLWHAAGRGVGDWTCAELNLADATLPCSLFPRFPPKKSGLAPKTAIFQFFFVHFVAREGLHSCVSDLLPLFIHCTCVFLMIGKRGKQGSSRNTRRNAGSTRRGRITRGISICTGTFRNHTPPPPESYGLPPELIRPPTPPESYGDPPESYGDPP